MDYGEAYRLILTEKINLHTRLKSLQDTDAAIAELSSIPIAASKETTPPDKNEAAAGNLYPGEL